MGLFQKLAGSFSIKWEFAKMGISEVSTARTAKNGIPLYRETPVRSFEDRKLHSKSQHGTDMELPRCDILSTIPCDQFHDEISNELFYLQMNLSP